MPRRHYRNASLEKGLTVLSEIAAAASPAGVTSIASRTGLDYTTTYRLIAALEHLGYVSRIPESKLYEPGHALRQLGLLGPSLQRLISRAIPVIADLVRELGETVNLSQWQGDRLVLLHTQEGTHMLTTRTPIGGEFPVYCTASGKVILAFMDKVMRADLLGRLNLVAMTRHTIIDRTVIERQLKTVLKLGYAINREEHVLGLSAVAVPIPEPSGRVDAVIDLSLPSARITAERSLEHLAGKLRGAAARILNGSHRHG
jgi:DNA-binding IclR family transcriptional regulator